MGTARNDSVCVCIAAFNAETTIARAVSSALRQSHVTEVIVVDDASTDATAEVARRNDDGSGRLSVIVLERNGGPSAARTAALATSRASIFCILDSDDYFVSDRIGRLMAASDPNEWDLLADDILIVPERLVGHHTITLEDAPPLPLLDLDLPTFVRNNIVVPGQPRAELGFLKPLIRRQFLDARGLEYDLQMRLGEDYALYVRALMAGARFKVVGFCGYIAVERANSLSSSHRAADLAAIRAFDEACIGMPGLDQAAREALAAHQRATTDRWAFARAIEIRREKGIGAALRFLARQPASAVYVASNFLRARSERLTRLLRGSEVVLQTRHLIDPKAVSIG